MNGIEKHELECYNDARKGKNIGGICKLNIAGYQATEMEKRAAALYSYIVLISSYPNMMDYQYYLNQEETREGMRRFLECVADLDIGKLYVSVN